MSHTKTLFMIVWGNNNNNELYLHSPTRDLQHCKSISTITKSKSNNNIKLSIINCLAFLNRMIRAVLTAF